MTISTTGSTCTPSQTVGPFFHGALAYEEGPHVVADGTPGSFLLSGHVYDGRGDPVADALVEIWQADPDGRFAAHPGGGPMPTGFGGFGFRGFGRCATDAGGRYWFRTVKPGAVPTLDGEPQAPHIAMAVFARGLLRQAVTRVYFPDSAEANAADRLLGTLDDARRGTLVARAAGGGLVFDVHLQGDRETVFLDVFTR
jgi:protocatechuate 3,4-dioxygenase alpha subunit